MANKLTRTSEFITFDGSLSVSTLHQRPDRLRNPTPPRPHRRPRSPTGSTPRTDSSGLRHPAVAQTSSGNVRKCRSAIGSSPTRPPGRPGPSGQSGDPQTHSRFVEPPIRNAWNNTIFGTDSTLTTWVTWLAEDGSGGAHCGPGPRKGRQSLDLTLGQGC
jgi:hypothetical protein